jgi:hypothetical protein
MAVRQSAPAVPGLRRDAIGLREVLFQSITDMAPGAAIAASIPAAGLIYLVYLYRHDRRRVAEVGLVHLDPLEEYGT